MENTESSTFVTDELTQLQLTVARRADELARSGSHPADDRVIWSKAESEIWLHNVRVLGVPLFDAGV